MPVPAEKARFSSTEKDLLDNLKMIIKVLQKNASRPCALDLTQQGGALFNAYTAFAVVVYTTKFKELYESVAESLTQGRYLIYVQAGRAIVETAATLRYYTRHPDLSGRRTTSSEVSPAVLEKAIKAIDCLVRESGASSKALVTWRFKEYQRSESDGESAPANVQTFLEDWYKESPRFRALHEAFCGLAEANLQVGRRDTDSMAQSGSEYDERSVTVAPSLAGLIEVYRVVQSSLSTLDFLRLAEGP